MKKRLKLKWLKRKALRACKNQEAADTIESSIVPYRHLQSWDGDSKDVPTRIPKQAEIYQSELEYVLRCILERPDIETGGELFGFWKDDGAPVVAYAIGPGPNANHEYAFFNQDIDYLSGVGAVLTRKFGLEHIGEWHSHHKLGLAHPSGHDAATITHGMASHRRDKFLLCIGTCSERSASLGGFVFQRHNRMNFSHVGWQVFGTDSPYRHVIDNDQELVTTLVHPKTMEEIRHG